MLVEGHAVADIAKRGRLTEDFDVFVDPKLFNSRRPRAKRSRTLAWRALGGHTKRRRARRDQVLPDVALLERSSTWQAQQAQGSHGLPSPRSTLHCFSQ